MLAEKKLGGSGRAFLNSEGRVDHDTESREGLSFQEGSSDESGEEAAMWMRCDLTLYGVELETTLLNKSKSCLG